MAKIVAISDTTISIQTDGGGVRQVRIAELSFTPKMGDTVDVLETDNKLVVSKVENVATHVPFTGFASIFHRPTDSEYANHEPANRAYKAPSDAQGRAVNRAIYCILAISLGSFGIHKFYAGKWMQGMLYLAFCWSGITAIFAAIEGIRGLLKPVDERGNIIL